MDNQPITRNRGIVRRRTTATSRRTSLLVFACTIPFASIVLIWQHAKLMDRLDGGGEYAAEFYDTDKKKEVTYWGDSMQQAVDVVKFVAYGSGLMSESNNEDDEIIDDDDDEIQLHEDEEVDTNEMSGQQSTTTTGGSIIPFDLSVNHLKLIKDSPGKPPLSSHDASSTTTSYTSEDFLPVVRSKDINLRWRHQFKVGSSMEHAAKVTAYRIEAQRFGIDNIKSSTALLLWDSDKVELDIDEELPYSIPWPETISPQVGEIIEWRVTLWDVADASYTSAWSKFAVGPTDSSEWQGQWIVHPVDMKTFSRDDESRELDECELWKKRHPLPMFRGEITNEEITSIINDEEDQLISALLVVSGLGSFRASFDGVPLSHSGPIDPPFTDYSKRVMYRGFDVTSFLSDNAKRSHVIGVMLGSGWWDHRPLESSIVKFNLLPRGPATMIAQLYITTSKGGVHIVMPTQDSGDAKWKVRRGYIRESDLFTGEMVDLAVMSDLEGWDTPDAKKPWPTFPVKYHTQVTSESRHEEISITAKAKERTAKLVRYDHFAAPIGKLVPHEIPPILPMERIAPDEVHDLGGGRWLLDFGKAFSGMLHFDKGLPTPIVPDGEQYPRAHGFKAATDKGDSFITVIYGESLEMTTGDINRVLVAGMGMHDGGPRHVSNPEGAQDNKQCFPDDHDSILTQRDVFVFPNEQRLGSALTDSFSHARQSHFTTHSFRFAEICCSAEPPAGVHALLYRTAFLEWGTFDSSNVLLNGGYELVKNAMASNMLSVQSDCPHREKLPYGGDLVADSPAAMHMYDMSSFYKKTVNDWLEAQWDNGAYTETSIWQDLNDYAGIGHGAGETVWATAPPVITVRHMQHYGDLGLLADSLPHHIRWLEFLNQHFDAGMEEKGYDKNLRNYDGEGSGLGDWLALRGRDTFLTHTAFYMAAARCVAYISQKLGNEAMAKKSFAQAGLIQKRIASLYLKNGKDDFDFPIGHASNTPGPEMSLFSKIVPGEKRCVVLKNYFRRSGSLWPGDEEKLFLKELDESYAQEMVQTGELVKESDGYYMSWSQWQGFNEGIFGIRYSLKTLSDMGFHNIALRKAAGFGFGTPEYMMRHNATTMWESWWRSEDLYSRNHPMLGALAEWMSSSAAGVSLFPTTVGGRHALFWPRFPKSATMLEYASATQGSSIGDYSIAWRFENLPDVKSKYNSAEVSVRIRVLIPPGGKGTLRLPRPSLDKTRYIIGRSDICPDLVTAHREASLKCSKRRQRRLGFPYSWEYNRDKKQWYKLASGKAIGTPCESYLFSVMPLADQWSDEMDISDDVRDGKDKNLQTGLYEIIISQWQLEPEIEGTGRVGNIPEYYNLDDLGPYCKDSNEFEWKIDDAAHII